MFGTPKFNIAGKDPSAFEKAPASPQNIVEQVEALRAEMQTMLDSHQHLFAAFAEDVSLTFVVSNAFYIDLEKGVVNLDFRWFIEQGYSREQIVWAVFHELSHFRDLARDPKGTYANFEYIKRRAKKTAVAINARVREVGETPNPTQAERAAHQIHHTFYNVFDDIYVNNTVSQRAPNYGSKKPGGKLVEDLYREKLFPGTDYTAQPKHLQFLYALLRQEMLPDEALTLSPDVEVILTNTYLVHEKKRYTIRQFIDAFLKPQSKADTRAGERYKLLKRHIEPLFERLVAEDIAAWKPPEQQEQKPQNNEPQEGGQGQEPMHSDPSDGNKQNAQKGKPSKGTGQPFEKEYEEFAARHIDQISDEDIERFTEQEITAQAEESTSAAEEAEKAQAELDAAWCEENNISEKELKDFRDIERAISPYLEELSQLWQRIVHGASHKLQRKMDTGYRRGSDLDIARTIHHWPEIQGGHADEARIMRRMSSEIVPVKTPERIRVRVLADNSGSMAGEKIHVQDQAIALLLSSLDEFSTHLNRTRDQTGSNLTIETEVWSFDDKARVVKENGAGEPTWNERAAMIRTVGKINGIGGGTNDANAYARVQGTYSPQELEDIASGKLLEIVFVITDGGSDDTSQARKQIDRLVGQGVIARAFQIGRVTPDEQRSFNAVWNNGRTDTYGVAVGSQVGNLIPAVAQTLKQQLSGVTL